MFPRLLILGWLFLPSHWVLGFVPLCKLTVTNTQQQQQQQQQSSCLCLGHGRNSDGRHVDVDRTPLMMLLAQRLSLLRQALEDEDIDTETANLSLLYTRISNLNFNITHVGPSTIAGRGLFASIDCCPGDLLTCYPGDALIIIPDDDDWTVLWGDHLPTGDRTLQDQWLGYMLHVDDDVGVLGLPDLDQDPAYLGHFANDGAVMPLTLESLAPYVLESQTKANAVHKDLEGSHMITVATRTIQAGEEILVSYGPDYWAEQPLFGTGSDTYSKRRMQPGSGTGFF